MKHTNQLIYSKSPYLLQHAHNPVDWHFWDDKTLKKARDENKPILVSIGYSSCHWCHVMEKESFEDEAIAEIMNTHFINIKIDREERPDLDHIYMDAVQAMTGSGGWPLNVFLTPDLKPFFGGTYFPPKSVHGRMSWQETLLSINNAFTSRKNEIESQAEKLTEYLKKSSNLSKLNKEDDESITKKDLETIAQNLLNKADITWGGFGSAPKFPQSFSILYLLRQFHFTKEKKCLDHALLSLDKMILGGIYDQIGGGFSRYSTDERWFAPHFEKMLYDNAMLVQVLSEAYQISKKEIYVETINQTLQFVERELMSEEFGFYSALDADSEGVEGKFYTWDKYEIDEILKTEAELFCETYNVLENGNWENVNILFLQQTIEEIAITKKIDVNILKGQLKNCHNKLLHQRENRIRPLLDDKILCSWNALMNIAYCKAYAATGIEHYRDIAVKNMNFLLTKMLDNDNLYHCYKNNEAYVNGFLEDYVYLIWALIHLQEITGNHDYLIKAKELTDLVLNKFNDENSDYLFFTSAEQKNIIVRKIDLYDGATPSANAVFALCLQYLSSVFYNEDYADCFEKKLKNLKSAIIKHPTSFSVWAIGLQNYFFNLKEFVITGKSASDEIQNTLNYYIPNKILLINNTNNKFNIPILEDKKVEEDSCFYLCFSKTCFPPQESFLKLLHLYNT